MFHGKPHFYKTLSEGHTKKDASIYYKCNKKTHQDTWSPEIFYFL